jgi:putative transposase
MPEGWSRPATTRRINASSTKQLLTIVDTFTPFSPALEPRFTFRGADVVEVLERIGRQVGFQASIRSIKAPSSCRVI